MTREEAIYWIKNLAVLSTEKDMASITEALNMAIAALKQLSLPKIIIRQGEQEPTAEYSSDVISRQAAIDAFDGVKVDEETEYDIGYNDGIDFAVSKLSVLPSAQPFTSEQIQTMQELESAQVKKAYELGKADRPKGYWIDTQVDSVGIAHRCICSICGEEPAAWSSINKFDFCPNCGADMRERGEG